MENANMSKAKVTVNFSGFTMYIKQYANLHISILAVTLAALHTYIGFCILLFL